MFTPDFRKARLALVTVFTLGLVYVGVTGALTALAHWAETRAGAYPYCQEDWLRVLVPGLFEGRGLSRVMIAGPSEAREDLLYDRFDREMAPLKAFQGAQALCTFDDFLLTLEYVERAYGPEAMPRAIVLGITPRFVANLPRGRSPLVPALNRYSPLFGVKSGPEGSRLVPKSFAQGLLSQYRFSHKRTFRYRGALCALMGRFLVDNSSYERAHEEYSRSNLGELMRFYTSPYKYHHLTPAPREELLEYINDPTSFWHQARAWDPEQDSALVRRQFARLNEILDRHDVQLYVVNLPEHPLNQVGYAPGRYESYLRLVRDCIGSTPFLDLRTMLSEEEFYDAGHATLPGAVRVTERVVHWLKDQNRVASIR